MTRCRLRPKHKLIRCSGLQKPVIYGVNIFLLHIYVWDGTEALTINCPKIRIIQLLMVDDLRVNGVWFHDLSFAVLSLEMECGINVIGYEFHPGIVQVLGTEIS